jgi:invasion protein IalB
VRFGASAVIAVALLSADAAFAQATKPASTPSASPTPAVPAPAGAAPAAPSQASGPVTVNLVPSPQPWTKFCSKDPAVGKDVCSVIRYFGQTENQPTLAVAVYQVAGDEKRILRVQLPLGFLIRPGFRLIIDKGDPIDGRFAVCVPNGCFGEAEVNGAALNALKKATMTTIAVRNMGGIEVTFALPMRDFGVAFDGPAVDPKVIEQQQVELQKQLEERARQEREALEKQQGVTGAATPTPTATPTPAK